MKARWWDGAGAWVESWRTLNGAGMKKQNTIVKLNCGHEQTAVVPPRQGMFVICNECAATGRPVGYEG